MKKELTHKSKNLRIVLRPISLFFKKNQLVLLPLFVLFCNVAAFAQPCTMACDNLVNVSLPGTCEATITYDMILEGNSNSTCTPNGPTAFTVTVMQNLAPIPTSPVVTANYINQTLTVKVMHNATGNSCWGSIHIEDKLAPQLTCPPDITVACTAPTDTSATGAATVTDCSTYSVTFYSTVQTFPCGGTVSATISRTWVASDAGGYTSTCVQHINIAQPTPVNIQWPPNRDGNAAPFLDCVNPNTAPSNTGFPMIGGFPIPTGSGYCNAAVTYSDQILPLCQNSFKILRNWTVVMWCTGSILTHTQIISVKDTHPAVLVCPPAFTAGTTSSQTCKASVVMPQVGITDDCSTTFTVTMNTPVGLISGNGGLVNNLNLGVYTITYNVTDACNNQSSCTTQLTVVDNQAPTVVCDEYTVVSLSNTGMAIVPATVFNDGSYDNCTALTFTARRMVAGCGTSTNYAPTVKFCCADVGTDVMVQMQASDAYGNVNSCMVTVHVEESSTPTISCPPNKTLTCLQDPNDLSLTGQATGTSACGSPVITFTDVVNLNQCNVGSIARTWKATSGSYSSTCVQTITLVDNTPVTVTFPPLYTTSGCVSLGTLDPANLPAPYNAPLTVSDCELLATSHTDQVFQLAGGPACFKIVRTWKVINWCTYTPGSSTGYWEGQQIIMVTDNTAPTFTCPTDLTVGVGLNCKASVTLPQVTNIQDCSPNVTVSVSSNLGNGYGPFLNVAPGNYTATYTISDGCGNSGTCTINISVEDLINPTPYCKNGLVVEMMAFDSDGDGVFDTGMATTWASDFNAGSFDNCPGTLQFSLSADVTNTSIVFDCDDLGQQPIQMWVTDAAGNQDFCQTFILVQDNMGACNIPLMASVGGAITNEMGQSVQGVMVSVSDGVNPDVMTESDGNFMFPTVELGEDYTVATEKDANLLNGVTTYDIVVIRKHIIGDAMLSSPYKMIAADINRSNAITTVDLVALQKAILHIENAFPNNESWRFVRTDYAFPQPTDPFSEAFPEVYNINNLASNMEDVNFIAVKIGDVNASASPNMLDQINEDRSGESLDLVIDDISMEAGQEYRIDFTAANFEGITGYQFTLDFDRNDLDFVRFEKGGLASLSEANFGFRLLEEGAITTSWNDVQGIDFPKEEVMFSLVFQANAKTKASQSLHISSNYTLAEAYKEDGELLDVALQVRETPANPTAIASLIVRPNPFRDATIIGFPSEEGGKAVLTIFDPSGKLVKMTEGVFGAGGGEFKVLAAELSSAGTYIFRVKTAEAVLTGKMVVVE